MGCAWGRRATVSCGGRVVGCRCAGAVAKGGQVGVRVEETKVVCWC